jgi:putative RNA ligase
MSKLKPYYDLVEQGYLSKQESGDLVLFNYNDQCTYERFWNEYTLSARGIIFNKITEEIVARPFPKFFNLSELENKSLPQPPMDEKYDVYEKVDGSLGILYQDTNGEMKIATRGSFTSPQALKATAMFNYKHPNFVKVNNINTFGTFVKYNTLLFEIIYPENRVNAGARLVTDYGSLETLILLGAINKETGKDADYKTLQELSQCLNLPLAKKYNLTIPEMVELKKTLPMQEEGWVVRFENGFRVKIKGDEYLKFHKLINSISPLSIWEKMVDGNLNDEYKKTIPEEILPEVNELEQKLMLKLQNVDDEVFSDYSRFQQMLLLVEKSSDGKVNDKKVLGLFCQDERFNVKHPGLMFLYHSGNMKAFTKAALKSIKPVGNIL